MPDTEQSQERQEPNGTTLSVEEWIEELNKCDRLHQYAKRTKERGEEKRKEPEENDNEGPNTTTLSTEEWIEELNKHDSFDQYAKRRKEKKASGGLENTN